MRISGQQITDSFVDLFIIIGGLGEPEALHAGTLHQLQYS